MTKVLLFGDSITHGKAGDWTWRYRLWERLREEGETVDLVGPEEGLLGNSLDYRDPDFDRDHASMWGAFLTPPAFDPGMLARVYQPDVVVVELGVNDLGGQQEAPAAISASMRSTVEQLRAEAPGVDVVLVHVPVVRIGGVAELNREYDGLAAELDAEEQRVVVAPADEGFVGDPTASDADTYDGIHPDPSGEVKIAEAVAVALAELGIGAGR